MYTGNPKSKIHFIKKVFCCRFLGKKKERKYSLMSQFFLFANLVVQLVDDISWAKTEFRFFV